MLDHFTTILSQLPATGFQYPALAALLFIVLCGAALGIFVKLMQHPVIALSFALMIFGLLFFLTADGVTLV